MLIKCIAVAGINTLPKQSKIEHSRRQTVNIYHAFGKLHLHSISPAKLLKVLLKSLSEKKRNVPRLFPSALSWSSNTQLNGEENFQHGKTNKLTLFYSVFLFVCDITARDKDTLVSYNFQ